jgi:hypothetical protein
MYVDTGNQTGAMEREASVLLGPSLSPVSSGSKAKSLRAGDIVSAVFGVLFVVLLSGLAFYRWRSSCVVVSKRKFVFFSCRVGTKIDPERESQDLVDRVFRHCSEGIQYKHYPRPETCHFTNELKLIKANAIKVSLHFSGHGNRRSGGLQWNGVPGERILQISGDQLANLIKLQDAVANIDSFFLNACCTLETGLELHAIGVRVVLCWQTSVTDRTARVFLQHAFMSFRAWRPYSMPWPFKQRAQSCRALCWKKQRVRASCKLAAAENRACKSGTARSW